MLLGCPASNFGPLPREQPHYPNVNHWSGFLIWPKGHWEPCNEVGFHSLAEGLVVFEPESFQFSV